MKKAAYIFFLGICLIGNLLAQQSLTDRGTSFYNIDSVLQKESVEVLKYKKLKDTLGLINAYLELAYKCNSLSRYKKSEEFCLKALQLSVVQKNNLLIATCFSELANMYSFKQDNANALAYYLKAKDIFDKSHDHKNQLKCLVNLGEFYRKVNQYDKSLKYLNQASHFYEANHMQDTLQLIKIYNRKGAVKYEAGDKDSSLFFSFKAVELSKLSHNTLAEARSLNEIGAVYRDKNDVKKAILYFTEAKNKFINKNEYQSVLEVMNNMALLYRKNNYPTEFISDLFNEIITLSRQHHIDFPLSDAYEYLYKTSLKKQDTAKAFMYLLALKNSDESYAYQKLNTEIVSLQEKYENEKMKQEVNAVSEALAHQKKETLIVVMVSVMLFLLLGLITYLLYANTKKKKLLQKQNDYKDTLIQEIHHRVKNNLEFINSLIDMQKNASDNNVEIYTLNDTARRMRSMSIVHEMLYSKGNIHGVHVKAYIASLVSSIDEMVNTEELPIEFRITIEDVILAPTMVIALGMITSELISNSIKYAFVKQKKPVITIELKSQQSNSEFQFVIYDNGIGYHATTNRKNKLGMRLVDIFSRQLKGIYAFESKQGLHYSIKFKL